MKSRPNSLGIQYFTALCKSVSGKTGSSNSAVPRSRKSGVSLEAKSLKRTAAANSAPTPIPSTTQHKPTKSTRNRVPPPQRERILQKYVAGKSVVDISVKEKRDRETISKDCARSRNGRVCAATSPFPKISHKGRFARVMRLLRLVFFAALRRAESQLVQAGSGGAYSY